MAKIGRIDHQDVRQFARLQRTDLGFQAERTRGAARAALTAKSSATVMRTAPRREGAVTREATEPLVLDLHLEAGARFEQPLPPGHNAFVVVYRGMAAIGGGEVTPGKLALLSNDPASSPRARPGAP